MNIILLGTYDLGKPRVRILQGASRLLKGKVYEIHRDVWSDIEDKSQISGNLTKFLKFLRWVFAYPPLIWSYMRAPKHDIVIIPYLGVIDVLIFLPFVKLRGATLYWDVFLSIYDTVVRDRKIYSSKGFVARLIYVAEWIASRAADVPFLDTAAHAEYFANLYDLPRERVRSVPVGVEVGAFSRLETQRYWDGTRTLEVLFYGQFIPLHGLDTIVDAIALACRKSDLAIRWTIVGVGQEAERIDARLRELDYSSSRIELRRIEWVKYEDLADLLATSDICLGVFGKSEKARRVIPNKVYQIMAMGKPLITASSPAIREIIAPNAAVEFAVAGDPESLLQAVEALAGRLLTSPHEVFACAQALPIYDVSLVSKDLEKVLGLRTDTQSPS